MSILQVVLRSLQEMIRPKRFLPFFMLYFALGVASYLLILPIANLILNPQFALTAATFLLINIALLFIVFILGAFVNLWFTAALVESVKSRSEFTRSLSIVKKRYLQLLALSTVIILLCMASFIFGTYRNLVILLLDCVLLFSMPAVVLTGISFEKGIRKSFDIFKSKFLETVAFWLINRFMLSMLFLVGIFFLSLSISPLVAASMTLEEVQAISTSTVTRLQVVGVVLANSPLMLVVIFLGSLFLSIIVVFDYTSRTYYFLELTKGRVAGRKKARREKRKGKRK